MKVVLSAEEIEWRDRMKRGRLSLADRATGCISSLCCSSWPDVQFFATKKADERFWSAGCPACYTPGQIGVRAPTRADLVAAWNKKHERWT